MAGEDELKEEATTGAPVQAVTLKLPPFWPADPELWIAQVEAQFRTRNILQDTLKFDYVVASLNPETAVEIRDILLHPPDTDKYVAIKGALLKRNELSDQKRLQELLSKEDLGDRRPTQVLRRMQQLVGDTQFDPKVLRALFIQKLPQSVQQIMVVAGEEVDLRAMAEMAERILDVTNNSINSVGLQTQVNAASASEISMLREEVSQLKKMMREMSTSSSKGGRSSSRGRSPFRRKRDPSKHPLCWYHHKFKDQSTKCESPCSWGNQQSGNGSTGQANKW